MVDPHDPLVQFKITSATCSFFAILFTVYRLYIRYGRYWADDACAFAALLALIIHIVAVFLRLPAPNPLSQTTQIAVYYLLCFNFYIIIWSSRLSILFSIIRINPFEQQRNRLFWVAVAFCAALLFFLAQLMWICEPKKDWKSETNPICPVGQQVAICQVITDVISDSILLFVPMNLFRSLRDKGLRHKLGIIFSTCVMTTVVSLVHAAYIVSGRGTNEFIAAVVEVCISVMVASLPIVTPRLISLGRERDEIRTYNLPSLSHGHTSWYNQPKSSVREGTARNEGGHTATFPPQAISTSAEESQSRTKSRDLEADCGDHALASLAPVNLTFSSELYQSDIRK